MTERDRPGPSLFFLRRTNKKVENNPMHSRRGIDRIDVFWNFYFCELNLTCRAKRGYVDIIARRVMQASVPSFTVDRSLLRLDVAREIIEDRLPAGLLLLD